LLPVSLPTSLSGLGGSSSASASPSASSSSSSSGSNPLAGFQIVLTLSGPEAACTAGPPGSSGGNFTATESLASASVEILENGKAVVPPIALSTGNILSQLPLSQLPLPKQLSSLLGSASPLDLTVNPGSTSGVGAGPVTTATAGELGLGVNGTQVLDVTGAKATCGPDNKTATSTTPTTTSSETPLGGGIQTDEGRSGSDSVLWAGVAGGAALGAATGGLTLWRRRRSAS
jgi:hypothetical protein